MRELCGKDKLSAATSEWADSHPPRPTADTPVAVIDLDERSFKEFGPWPWPRTLIADLLAVLFNAGAVVVAFDVIFAEPDRLSPDQLSKTAARA